MEVLKVVPNIPGKRSWQCPQCQTVNLVTFLSSGRPKGPGLYKCTGCRRPRFKYNPEEETVQPTVKIAADITPGCWAMYCEEKDGIT
jgi:hypothetical protein